MPAGDRIVFNNLSVLGSERSYIDEAIASGKLSGDGRFTRACESALAALTGGNRVLLTNSCTAALEMAALLLDLRPGDEVIMPSFAFASIANAVVLRGAVPVFVDIDPSTLNLDPVCVANAITRKTRAIFVVHYAGVVAEMDELGKIARDHNVALVEDAAQALGSSYHDKPAGSLGDLAAFSFHDTKNVVAGEGGCLVVNRDDLLARAEIIREKGTNRSAYFRKEVDHYTWVDVGSSYVVSELNAAFLLGQIEKVTFVTEQKQDTWSRYHDALLDCAKAGAFRLPNPPAHCRHNGHIFYLILPDAGMRPDFFGFMNKFGIDAQFHFVPLHSSPAGRRYGRAAGSMGVTDETAAKLVRLPIHLELGGDIDRVIDGVRAWAERDATGRG